MTRKQPDTSTYTRSTDGATMVAIESGVFVNAALLSKLRLVPHDHGLEVDTTRKDDQC